MAIQNLTERELDLALYNDENSFNRLIGGYDMAPITSPLCIITAVVFAILYKVNVVPRSTAFALVVTLGPLGVIFAPIAAFRIYDFHRYRNKPMTQKQIEEKFEEIDDPLNHFSATPRAEAVNQIAMNHNISLRQA